MPKRTKTKDVSPEDARTPESVKLNAALLDKQISRLLSAADYCMAEFTEKVQKIRGPLAALETGQRALRFALELNEAKRQLEGTPAEQGDTVIRFEVPPEFKEWLGERKCTNT